MSEITIYTTATCPYCIAAKRLLKEKGAAFTEVSVDGDRAGRVRMSQRASGRTTVPQIFIGDRHIGGCDDLYQLEREGRLDPLLSELGAGA